jgi:hypothetical protein
MGQKSLSEFFTRSSLCSSMTNALQEAGIDLTLADIGRRHALRCRTLPPAQSRR